MASIHGCTLAQVSTSAASSRSSYSSMLAHCLQARVNPSTRKVEFYLDGTLLATCGQTVPMNSPIWVDTSFFNATYDGRIRNAAWLAWTTVHQDNDNNRLWSDNTMQLQDTTNGEQKRFRNDPDRFKVIWHSVEFSIKASAMFRRCSHCLNTHTSD